MTTTQFTTSLLKPRDPSSPMTDGQERFSLLQAKEPDTESDDPILEALSIKRMAATLTEPCELVAELSKIKLVYKRLDGGYRKGLARLLSCVYQVALHMQAGDAEWQVFCADPYWNGKPQRPKLSNQQSSLRFVLLWTFPKTKAGSSTASLYWRALKKSFERRVDAADVERCIIKTGLKKLASEQASINKKSDTRLSSDTAPLRATEAQHAVESSDSEVPLANLITVPFIARPTLLFTTLDDKNRFLKCKEVLASLPDEKPPVHVKVRN